MSGSGVHAAPALRVRNWDVELVRWGSTQVGRPYEWGETDCGALVRWALTVMYGADPLAGPGWTGFKSAVAWLKKAGGAELLLQHLHGYEIGRLFAQGGDVVLFPGDHEGLPRFAVMLNATTVLVSTPEEGVTVVRPEQLPDDTRFWRLPA